MPPRAGPRPEDEEFLRAVLSGNMMKVLQKLPSGTLTHVLTHVLALFVIIALLVLCICGAAS
eukprot:CAMPEP_0115360726 /NCGR_PEP_ID=MMETSP0270-20121206/101838_1 /TAXON_ID=71861 /ORGANISM="Scrippsiella trochoidea, Strain CCMP3099" /LENGTH=61 /DNA_ID=CAMNT_0002783275 /DNA_START=15 /DNA_END=196 /DNA_ORIENTATION=+